MASLCTYTHRYTHKHFCDVPTVASGRHRSPLTSSPLLAAANKTICFCAAACVRLPYHQPAHPTRRQLGVFYIFDPPPALLGIQLPSIQTHNRSWIKQTHLGHTLAKREQPLLSRPCSLYFIPLLLALARALISPEGPCVALLFSQVFVLCL